MEVKNNLLTGLYGYTKIWSFEKNIHGITHKMLSSQLKDLENESIIFRKEYPQIPPKVEYSLTQKGQSLIPLIKAMCDWGKKTILRHNILQMCFHFII
ncbi:hypothetical protein C1145_14370 [Clostridium botulinum]|nr:hypothetical protein C1145_14370 [Clostridium botulinum]RFM20051.1 hypothetical protein C1146_21255 [Clostridium botulinum]